LFPGRQPARSRRHEIPACIGSVITADAFLLGIEIEKVFRPVRVVLARQQTFRV